MKRFFIISILIIPFLSIGQTSADQYLIKIDKYSYYAKPGSTLYKSGVDTIINMFIPTQADKMVRTNTSFSKSPDTLDTTNTYIDTTVNIFIPIQLDTTVQINKHTVTLDTSKLVYDQFMGYIPLNYLDTFLSKEIIIMNKGQKLKIDWLSFSIYRSDGKSNRNNSETKRMGDNTQFINFLKVAPVNSYIIIDEIWVYVGKNKIKYILKKVAWKIIDNN